MAVKLRLMRVGKRNHPAYRICAVDAHKPRDGAYLDNVGFYDPHIADDKRKIRIDKERAEYWLSVGAQPTETVLSFLKKAQVAGLIRGKRPSKRRKKTNRPQKTPTGTAARKPPKKPKPPNTKKTT